MLPQDFIVCFTSYVRADRAHRIVHDALRGQHGAPAGWWRVLPRRGPAYRLPSDFAVVRLQGLRRAQRRRALRALRRHSSVRLLSPERRYGPAEPKLSKHLQSLHDEADRHRHSEPAELGEQAPPHPPAAACDAACSADRTSTGRRLGRGRPVDRFPSSAGHPVGAEQCDARACGNASLGPTPRQLLFPGHASVPREPVAQITAKLNAEALWRLGHTGAGVRVAVFDTGLGAGHPHLHNVEERTNWTDEDTVEDGVGHGSFVAGVIGSSAECLGFAPDAQLFICWFNTPSTLHIFKVFNSKQVSYTSWFLDAFNYALYRRVHVLNLSIGGPDFADQPFTQKVNEVAAHNVLIVSGIGNSGPLWGTLMNPADQPDVLGVGGIDDEGRLAPFSSRGMSGWELPDGGGRVKPDVVTYGSRVSGSGISGGCRALSGTSVACPVVAGAAALLASTIPEARRWQLLNPASLKQVLLQAARRLPGRSAFEQGAGKLELLRSAQILQDYTPHASVLPTELDLSPCGPSGEDVVGHAPGGGRGEGVGAGGDAGYLWPHCSQPLYAGAVPLLLNLTLLNGMSVVANFSRPPRWVPRAAADGRVLRVAFEHRARLWPWGGTLGVVLSVSDDAAGYEGLVRGAIVFEVGALLPGDPSPQPTSVVRVPLTVYVVPTPPRERRLLFDAYHNLRYPPAYLPRDNLQVTEEMLDWTGDHLHTNYREMFVALRQRGWFVETLGCSYLCFNASQYGALLLVDTEDDFGAAEQAKLHHDVLVGGLSVVVLAEWHHPGVIKSVRFFDENTHAWMEPLTGGANLPALNELLGPLGLAFGSHVLRGELKLGGHAAPFASGAPIARLAAGGWLARVPTMHDEAARLSGVGVLPLLRPRYDVPVLGLLEPAAPGAGRIAAFGDTECVDSAALTPSAGVGGGRGAAAPCWWLLQAMLEFACLGQRDAELFPERLRLRHAYPAADATPSLPRRDAVAPLGVHSRSGRDAPCLLERLGLVRRIAPPSLGSLPMPLPFGGLAAGGAAGTLRAGSSLSYTVDAPMAALVVSATMGTLLLLLVAFRCRRTPRRRDRSTLPVDTVQ